MTTHKNKNLRKVFTHFITTFLILFLIISCEQKTAIPPQAEITNIYNITDTSANVDVQVTKQSNANGVEEMSLVIDSITKTGNKLKVEMWGLTGSTYTLNSSYSTVITNLKSKTQYYIYLNFQGIYDIGGSNATENFNIGSPKTFTTN